MSEVAKNVLWDLPIGQSERETAHHIDKRIHDIGFECPAFDTIVASGPMPPIMPTVHFFSPAEYFIISSRKRDVPHFIRIHDEFYLHLQVFVPMIGSRNNIA